MNKHSHSQYYGLAAQEHIAPYPKGAIVKVVHPGKCDLLRAGTMARVERCYMLNRHWYVDLYSEKYRTAATMLVDQVEHEAF